MLSADLSARRPFVDFALSSMFRVDELLEVFFEASWRIPVALTHLEP